MRRIVALAAPVVRNRQVPPRRERKNGPKIVSAALGVLLAGAVIGLVPVVGHSQPVIESFSFGGVTGIGVAAGPGFSRQSETLVASLVVTSDTNYSIEVRVEPEATGWASVYMNAGNHSLISSENDWHLGFDIAITEEGDTVNRPSVTPCEALTLGGWCMGSVTWEHTIAVSPDTSETKRWDIHVRMVLVDEDDETAGFLPPASDHDNVRFASLPSDGSRVVDVVVVVTGSDG